MSNKNKKGGQSMAQTAEEKRVKQEQDELQKQQDQVDPDENLDDETSQGEDEQDDEEEKAPLIQRIKAGMLKAIKILIKWVIKPLAIAIVVFASMISLIVNLGPGKDQQDEGGDTDSSPDEEDAPEEEFDDSDQDIEDQVE